MIRQTSAGVEISVRAIPRARRSAIDGVRAGHLLVRLAAPPVDGAANDELRSFLSRSLDLPLRNITLVAGATSRTKRILIEGLLLEQVRERLLAGRQVR